MPMDASLIVELITRGLPGSTVRMDDLRGDGDHWHATVTSPTFAGQSRIQQHKTVYAALEGRVGGELHALSLTTKTPDQI